MPVSASGESEARSSSTIRSSSSKSMSSSAIVTSPSSSAACGVERARRAACARRVQVVVVAPEAGLQPGEAVAHREARRRWLAVSTIAAGLGVGVDVLVDALEHVLPVAGQGQLEQQPGEAAARLDHGEQAAAGDVEPLERALVVAA